MVVWSWCYLKEMFQIMRTVSSLVSRTAPLSSALSWFFPFIFILEVELPSWSELQFCSFCFWKYSPALLLSFRPYISLRSFIWSCCSSRLQHLLPHLHFYIRLYVCFAKTSFSFILYLSEAVCLLYYSVVSTDASGLSHTFPPWVFSSFSSI